MSMTEEPRTQSIQERIRALNQAQVGLNPHKGPTPRVTPVPPARPAALRANTINNPPHEVTGSVLDSKPPGNTPASLRQNGLLPPPVSIKNGGADGKVKSPTNPPLPTRPQSNQAAQPAPALPPRRPSSQLHRSPSIESTSTTASFASYTTTSTTGRKSIDSRAPSVDGGSRRNLPPAWGETELPALPPRKSSEKSPNLPSRPKPTTTFSTDSMRKLPPPGSPKPPQLPSRRSSTESGTDESAPPKLPVRRPSADASGDASSKGSNGVSAPKRLPPLHSADALNKVRQSSFATLSSHREETEPAELPGVNGQSAIKGLFKAPPPVPLGSRPDLSALQATKPKLNGVSAPASTSTGCMVCRDFSGPDNHAAQFPRQSLPSNDLAWLAHQLADPFPSHTDKARSIFTWLHYNIKYDVDSFFNHCVKPSTPASTLQSGLAVCEGYAGLFVALATHAGLEAISVSGHGKGFGHINLAPGAPPPPYEGNHAWNAVKIDGGRRKLIDPCWGAGAVQGKGQPYIQRLDTSHFTMSNEEFGLKHFPANKSQFFREDGRPGPSWEEYILDDPSKPFGLEQPVVYNSANDNAISNRSFLPAVQEISIHQAGPLRFQFSLLCEHWTLPKNSKISAPYLFILGTHGIDGRKDEHLPFNYVKGTGPNGGGDVWYLDIEDPRTLGAPGQKLLVFAVTSFGTRHETRGLTLQEYKSQVGRVGMGFAGIAEWRLVA